MKFEILTLNPGEAKVAKQKQLLLILNPSDLWFYRIIPQNSLLTWSWVKNPPNPPYVTPENECFDSLQGLLGSGYLSGASFEHIYPYPSSLTASTCLRVFQVKTSTGTHTGSGRVIHKCQAWNQASRFWQDLVSY